MREILFRGKVADEPDEWVIGDLLRSFGHFEYMIRQYDTHDKTKCCGIGTFDVKPETVGQYTGLTDKNGVKIFEGDIVDCWSAGTNAKGTVIQRIDGLWIIYPAWQMDIMWGLFPDRHGNTAVEVIGNKYDNPELVKELE